jgi:S1-C subfamily serine protease
VTRLDWIVFGVVVFTALLGLWQGFTISLLSAAGVIAGGFIGARVAPHLLPDGAESPYTPLVALAGAAGFAILLEILGSSIGLAIRRRLPQGPLRTADSVGGLAFGALAGLALVWIVGAVALQLPGQQELRREVQQSALLRELNELVPPQRALRALARVDPFPSIAGPAPPASPPDPSVLRQPGVRRAAPSVVRILGTACGLGVSGSGWVAGSGIVVTNAHVVAGADNTTVTTQDGAELDATAIYYEPKQDLALLRIGAALPTLPISAKRREGEDAAVLGYPENGPYVLEPARIGETRTTISEDSYGDGPVERTITALSGSVRSGNSGGPLVDGEGAAVGTVFAATTGGPRGGFAIPAEEVRAALRHTADSVNTGPCTG